MSLKKNENALFWTQAAGIFLVSIFVFALFGLLPKNLIPKEFTTTNKQEEKEKINYSTNTSISDPNSLEEVSYVRDREGRILRSEDNSQLAVAPTETQLSKPSRILIPSVGIDSVVLQPQSPMIDVLDSALQKGAVYYPGSGFIEKGNIFIFGHSSGLPVVINQAYKTFNGIEKSKIGDEIILYANGQKYTYVIEKVYQADAESAFIDLSRSGRRLTISTCNSFGTKSDRWVVDAVIKG
ncbi:MAG: sortase [Candidatus Paceibacterota bacterium]